MDIFGVSTKTVQFLGGSHMGMEIWKGYSWRDDLIWEKLQEAVSGLAFFHVSFIFLSQKSSMNTSKQYFRLAHHCCKEIRIFVRLLQLRNLRAGMVALLPHEVCFSRFCRGFYPTSTSSLASRSRLNIT